MAIKADGEYVKFDDIKELLNSSHTNAMDAICPYYKVNDLSHAGDRAGTVECTCFGRPGKQHQ